MYNKATGVKNILFNIIYLFFGNVVTKLLGAFATILYANFTGVSEYGILSIALSFSAIMTFLTDSGVGHTAIREGTKKDSDLGKIMYSYTKFRCILFIFVSLLSVLLINLIYKNDPVMIKAILLLVIPSLVGSLLQGIGVTYFQIVEKMKYVSFINILLSVGNSLALFLGVILNLSIIEICFIYGASSIISGAYALIIAVKRIKFKKEFDNNILFQLLSFTTNSVIIILTPQLGPIILEKVLSVQDVGYYSAAFKIPAILYQFPGIIATAFYPKLFSLGNENNVYEHRKMSSLELQLMTILGAILALPFILNAKYWIVTLLGEKYLPAVGALVILSYLVFTQAVKFPLADFLTTSNRQWQRTIVMLSGLIISILGYIYLGRYFGVSGGALAPVLADVIMIIGCLFFIPNGFKFLWTNTAMIIFNFIIAIVSYKLLFTQFHPLIGITIAELIFIGLIVLTNKESKNILNLVFLKFKKN